ncbi:hypothetical protein RDI58_026867 [Solanum bulbocastanum]|uniref:CCHC-type domain-containing protein n=1 Tax=Solanum bulbocastanum TaxID=147425 RepID=A0AAN8T2C8_SOLBU
MDDDGVHVDSILVETTKKINFEEVMLPPITRKQPGKPPSNNRKKGFNEGKYNRSKVTCSKCGTSWHNKRTCPKFAYQN